MNAKLHAPCLPEPLPHGVRPHDFRGQVVGWVVHLGRRGALLHRQFWASTYGGLDAAFRAACAFREQVEREYPLLSITERCATQRSDNTSGIPGTSRQMVEGKPYWVAEISARGFKQARRFSIRKYGEERARQLAIEARRAMLEQVQSLHEGRAGPSAPQPLQPEGQALIRPATLGFPLPNPYAERAAGVLGVRLKRNRIVLEDGTVSFNEYWLAMMSVAGRRYERYFSVRQLGHEEARRQAIEQRLTWEAEHKRPSKTGARHARQPPQTPE